MWIIPKPLRDGLYDWVARNRYRWFGKKEEGCWLPRPEWKNRFLD
jgi:predicted DCC family thiol-disulfide oxidoreductase YuxK